MHSNYIQLHQGFPRRLLTCNADRFGVWPDRFDKYRRIVIGARLIHIEGRVQRSGAVVHLVAERFTDCTEQLVTLMAQKGMQTTAHLPKILRPKKQTGRKTPREMAWRGLQ